MKKLLYLFPFLFLACSQIAEKPKKLLPEEQMSAIIADFAIYDQVYSVTDKVDTQMASRYVLQKHHTDAKTYRESYQYYFAQPSVMNDILEDAKKIILEKDPKLEQYIEKKKKEKPGVPEFAK